MKRHKVSNTKKLVNLENKIQSELVDLKTEIEEADMLFGNWSKPISSVMLPKDINYFKEERGRIVAHLLQVTDAPQLKNIADVMTEELDGTFKSDFTENGLPLILHEFFVKRAQCLVQCKHSHLLRWRRFCQHTAVIEKNYKVFKKRLESINQEYDDCKQRALRLSKCYDEFIRKQTTSMACVKSEDIAIYLRWLVTSSCSIRKPMSYIRILQWVPVIHRNILGNPSTGKSPGRNTIGKDYTDDVARVSRKSELDFHGFVSDELTSSVPLQTLDLADFRGHLEILAREYEIEIKSELSSSADEMELFGSIIRQFKRLFNLQEECMTFYHYDAVPDGNEHWGIDAPTHCLLKPCNWTEAIVIHPRKNATQERQIKCISQCSRLDELLLQCNSFLKISDHSLMVERLKRNGSDAQKQYHPKSIQVASNRNGTRRTGDMWRAFYKNPEIREELQASKKNEKAGAYNKSDDYDFSNAMQSLGLDESEETSSIDQHVAQGAYLSFLHLRVLKLRDIRRQCLALLNYFRSVERTITIYDGGLSMEDEPLVPEGNQSSRSHSRSKKSDHSQKKMEGIGNHSYINGTPLDYKLGELDFMRFGGIANHDDFYRMDGNKIGESGDARTQITASNGSGISVPHVQDQRGLFVMYDLAVKDFEEIEKQLLLVASHFISKPKNQKKTSAQSNSSRSTFDILHYANHRVDRFAVLLDAWTCHVNFLHSKRELLDCYLEAYGNIFDPKDKRAISQVITDVIHKQPLFDFTQDYFIESYKLECSCLQLKTTLTKRVLNSQIEDTRAYTEAVLKREQAFGLPYPIETTQMISLNLPCSSLLNMDLLEFHPTLGLAAIHLSEALKEVLDEVIQSRTSGDLTGSLRVEKSFLELAIHEWEEMTDVGSSYSKVVQKQMLSGHYCDSPILLEDAITSAMNNSELGDTESKSEKESRAKTSWTSVLEGVVLQQRLRDAAWETEILARLYTRTCKALDFPEGHMYLRIIQMEDASAKLTPDLSKVGMALLSPNDANVDRYSPDFLPLAIHELDTSHLSKFSFHDRNSLLKIINTPNALDKIRVSLACQLAHRNSLAVAVNLIDTCMLWDVAPPSSPDAANIQEDAGNAKISHMFGRYLTEDAPSNTFLYGSPVSKREKLPFISIQLEKIPPRDAMVNAFIRAKETSGLLLQKQAEVVKLKFKLVEQFCRDFSHHTGMHAMRLQIVACYSAIAKLLKRIPAVKEMFFLVGRPHEKKRKLDDVSGLVPDPRTMHQRPRRVFSSDGKDILNLWFIPHYTEILFSYHLKDQEAQWSMLRRWLEIASSLHDIMQYLLGHATLGNVGMGPAKAPISADWGGTEGIGSQLTEIQKQLNHLKTGSTPYTRHPDEVAEFLKLKRDTMFLEFEHGVLSYIQKFHSRNFNPATDGKGIVENAHFALQALSSHAHPSLYQTFVHVPEATKHVADISRRLYPSLSFQDTHDRFPLKYRPHWNNVEDCMHLCLAALEENDRQRMNGELVGAAMIYQDVLNGGTKQLDSIHDQSSDVQEGLIASIALSKKKMKSEQSLTLGKHEEMENGDGDKEKDVSPRNEYLGEPLSKTTQPIVSYSVVKTYFILSKQLEQVKRYWSARKLPQNGISTMPISIDAERTYIAEIYIPVLQILARKIGVADRYDNQASLDEVPPSPPNTPEITLKAGQLCRLLEAIELQMLRELRQKIQQETALVLAERSREETALPTDLWKKGQIKETLSIGRPTLVQDFLHELLGDYEEKGKVISFNSDHLNQCVFNLASAAMNREKHNYELYSTFYENLLRHHHHLLYQKEREVETVRLERSEATGSRINAQFQLADDNRDLIVEVTALRAAVTETKARQEEREALIRQKARAQYQDLVKNLFQECLRMKQKLAENQMSLYEDVASLVAESKNESLNMLKSLRHEAGNVSPEDRLNKLTEKDEKMRLLQAENGKLKKTIKKLQALHHWRRVAMKFRHSRDDSDLFAEFMECKKDLESTELTSMQDRTILEEQLLCARKAVEKASLDLHQAYNQLEREREEQKERLYREAKQEQKRKHLSEVQKKNLQRLGTELVEKDKRLTTFLTEKEKMEVASDAWQSKTRRDVQKYQQQLMVDRSLKLEAFNRIDDLQAHIWDFEHVNATPQTPGRIASSGIGSVSGYESFAVSRAMRPSSCFPSYKRNGIDEPKGLLTKRPSTSSARFRTRSSRRNVHGLSEDGKSV